MNETDADILFPDQAVMLAGERVVVREFRFLEGLEVAVLARPLLEQLRRMHADGQRSETMLEALLIEHRNLVSTLMAMACDRDADWIATLSDSDGMALASAFWRANSGFFMRRLVLHLGMERALGAVLGLLSPSPSSSTPSSAPATESTPRTSPAE